MVVSGFQVPLDFAFLNFVFWPDTEYPLERRVVPILDMKILVNVLNQQEMLIFLSIIMKKYRYSYKLDNFMI